MSTEPDSVMSDRSICDYYVFREMRRLLYRKFIPPMPGLIAEMRKLKGHDTHMAAMVLRCSELQWYAWESGREEMPITDWLIYLQGGVSEVTKRLVEDNPRMYSAPWLRRHLAVLLRMIEEAENED